MLIFCKKQKFSNFYLALYFAFLLNFEYNKIYFFKLQENSNDTNPHLNIDQSFLRDFSSEEYQFILNLKVQEPKRAFQRICKKIRKNFPDLSNHTDQQLEEMFERTKDSPQNIYEDIREYFQYPKNIIEMKNYLQSPLTYLYNNGFPLFKSKSNSPWSAFEVQRLKDLVYNFQGNINFGFCALCFPGRTGKQINAKYKHLVLNGEIDNVNKDNGNQVESINNKTYFTDEEENQIAEEIYDSVKKGIQINKEYVTKKVTCFFYEPWNIAKRAAIHNFENSKKQIYEDENKCIFTQEFLDHAQEIQKTIDDLNDIKKTMKQNNEDDQQDKIESALEVMRKYDIKKPSFSYCWLTSFMKRNRLSWRKAHYARRCAIDKAYASLYKDLVAEAVCKYGWDYVFNMDETSVRINNGSTKTIAPIALDEIVIEGKRNEKECFTAIGTSTRNGLKELILLTKGTEKSCSKYFTDDEMKKKKKKKFEVWPTNNQNGWVNEEIVLRYLKHLHDNWSKGQPCALIMDCYKAHHTLNVIKKADDLNIQLIFVPANGTSIYQPLDRRIFGIVKSKLRSFAKSDIFSGPDRFKIITEHLIKAWNAVSEEALKSAWDIPDVERKIDILSNPIDPSVNEIFKRRNVDLEKILNNEEEDNEDFFDEYFEEEEEDSDVINIMSLSKNINDNSLNE